jgi:hypothetical protein
MATIQDRKRVVVTKTGTGLHQLVHTTEKTLGGLKHTSPSIKEK